MNVGESSQFLEATHYNIEMSGFSNAQLDDSVFVDHPRPEDFPKLDMEIEGAPILETTNHEGLIRSINRMPSVSSSKVKTFKKLEYYTLIFYKKLMKCLTIF